MAASEEGQAALGRSASLRWKVVQPVHRGTTGVVFDERHPHAGLVQGSNVQGIIARWDIDAPVTRVEAERL